MSDNKTTTPAVRLVVGSIEGNIGEYLSLEFLETVNGVFNEMLSSLYYGAEKRRDWATSEPWKDLSESECRTCIRDAIGKGNLIDAMNYLMFAHLNRHTLITLRYPTPEVPVSVDSQMRDQLAKALGTAGRTWEEMLTAVSAALKDAYRNERTLASIAKELNLDPDVPADTIISTVHLLVTARQSAVTEGRIDDRKVSLSPAIAAPYGVKPSKKRQQYELTMDVDNSGIASPLFIFRSKKDRDDYLPLLRTFLGALEQAAYGKGRERHANDLPFTEQPILTMARMLDNDAGLAQQVIKKTIEARSLPSKTARINELRGTLVYAAAMILFEEMFSNKCEPFEEFDL